MRPLAIFIMLVALAGCGKTATMYTSRGPDTVVFYHAGRGGILLSVATDECINARDVVASIAERADNFALDWRDLAKPGHRDAAVSFLCVPAPAGTSARMVGIAGK